VTKSMVLPKRLAGRFKRWLPHFSANCINEWFCIKASGDYYLAGWTLASTGSPCVEALKVPLSYLRWCEQ